MSIKGVSSLEIVVKQFKFIFALRIWELIAEKEVYEH